MQPSVPGLIVCAILLVVAYYSKGMLIIGLVASLAFGATAAMTLTALGGSSPLIYTMFAALLITAVAARRRIWFDLGTVFGSIRPLWVLIGLMAYAFVGALLLPRFLAGQATVFVVSARAGVVEAPLAPSSGNITQTGYFILGGLTAIALCTLLLHSNRIDQVRRGFFLWCTIHIAMGMLDLVGKSARINDVLLPIKTASYAMISGDIVGGFARITGAFSEASAFGAMSVACLAFTYTYWRKSGSSRAQWLSIFLLLLIILSTSSTAYAALAILTVPVGFSILILILRDNVGRDEILLVALMVVIGATIMGVAIFHYKMVEPFVELLETTIIDKADSASGVERAYWNVKSLQAFVDTSGLGIGFGSSRASSWVIAVLSQLGIFGSVLMAVLLGVVARGLGNLRSWVDPETDAVVTSVRNAALASLVASSLAGGSADPGILFFIAFAVVAATRTRARRNKQAYGRATPPRRASTPSFLPGAAPA